MSKLVLPVGTDSFSKIRSGNYYYVDKSLLIKQLVEEPKEVTLITRPRRFGKSLNMSMLDCFFNIDKKSENLFDGLKISEHSDIYDEWKNNYPTIFISFKDVKDISYNGALSLLKDVFSDFCDAHLEWSESDKINEYENKYFNNLHFKNISADDLKSALFILCRIAYKIYDKKVILLIDEYDVPIAQGNSKGYYDKIINIMSTMYSKALKSNEYLNFAVVTGCLRIAKESIFTGLNNFQVDSIIDGLFEEFFGFTDEEINELLSYYDMNDKKSEIKSWYDGYLFGEREVYCPWDVISYVDRYKRKPSFAPINFWANTSSNDIIRSFLDSDLDVNEEFETLLKGGYIKKIINEDVTYKELISKQSQQSENHNLQKNKLQPNEENFWTILLMTGYLTIVPDTPDEAEERSKEGMYQVEFTLRIPNKEIMILFKDTVYAWFKDNVVNIDRTELIKAIWNSDENTLTQIIEGYIADTISYYDYYEYFYHAFVTGLLLGVKGCTVKSNREAGTGRADVIFKDRLHNRVAIFEVKRAETENESLENLCSKGLAQIEKREYAKSFRGYKIYKYGISCYKKSCLVKASKNN